jgi:hypothetical protein
MRADNLGPTPAQTQERQTAKVISFLTYFAPGRMSGVNIGLPGLINGGPQIAAARAKLAKLEAERHQPLVGTLGAERVAKSEPDACLDLPFHPAAELFPLMTQIELEALAENIATIGQQDPIKTLDGGDGPMVLIGRNRFRACQMRGLTPWIEPISEGFNGDPVALVIASNRHRVHLTGAQLAWIGFQYTQLNYGEALTQAEAARRMSVNIDQIRSAAAIDRVALPEIKAAIVNGKIGKIGHAYKIVTPDKDERREGLTSEQKQTQWLNNPGSIGGARKLGRPVFPITAKQIKALTGDHRVVIADKLLEGLTPHQLLALLEKRFDVIERALEPGMQIFIGERP